MKNISVVIPLFNEEDGIPELSRRLSSVLDDLDQKCEILIVDDGSTDDTLAQLRYWQKTDSRVVIIKLSRNFGHQNAFNAGLDVAKGDAVIFMDGDLEDPPELIPELVKNWLDGYDTVYTVKASRHQPWFRKMLTRFYYRLLKSTTHYGIEPQSGMYSLVDEKVANVLRCMKESNKSYPNLRALAGFKQKAVFYSRDKRAYGAPKQTLRHLISDGLNALFSNTYLPIRVFTTLGAFFSLFFIIIGMVVVFVRISGVSIWIFKDLPGTQMILIAVLAFGALQITFLGVLGEYIARIYEESKSRPYYVVENIERADNK